MSPSARKIPAVPPSRPSVITFQAPASSSSLIQATHWYGAKTTSESFEPTSLRTVKSPAKSAISSSLRSHVEISDGTLDIPRDRKLELIADFARDFTVLSEVGSKDSDVVYAPYQWVAWIKEELEAGAWKVITEGREGGTAGIFRADGDMRTGLLDEIAHEIAVESLLFEAPTKTSQAWFVKHFGPNVNLGNIPPDEVIALETLRLGLRADTLKEILLASPAVAD